MKSKGGNLMGQLSEKELACLQDLLNDEELLTKKFQMLAEHAQDEEVKDTYMRISAKHKEHFDRLYAQLN